MFIDTSIIDDCLYELPAVEKEPLLGFEQLNVPGLAYVEPETEAVLNTPLARANCA